MSYNQKKFLDYNGLIHLLGKFDDYPTNDILGTVINSIDTALAGKVDDVQVNGTSIVNNNIAHIPAAVENGTPGIVKIGNDINGLAISSGTGNLYISGATSSQIKVGAQEYKPIVAYHQHESVFYGLAKAAGDSTQSVSLNAVGTYTTTAATAIKTMLQVQEGLEVVRLI